METGRAQGAPRTMATLREESRRHEERLRRLAETEAPLGSERRIGPAAAGREDALRSLPHPLDLLERASPSQHYHFGLFERPDEDLKLAQDRLAWLGCEFLKPGTTVLEVGCGMGGTAELLAARGHRVVGIDPCGRRIAYARALGPGSGARFLVDDLLSFAKRPEERASFRAITCTEILEHFEDLAEFLAACRGLLETDGLLVLKDMARAPHVPREAAKFPLRDELVDAGRSAGFDLVRRIEFRAAVRPTLPALIARLEGARPRLCAEFEAPGRDVARELERLCGHMSALARALDDGHLCYEHTLLRRR